MSKLAAGFVRVSTGSQDEASQVAVIEAYAAECGVTIVKWFKLHGYSASKGTQEPALREVVGAIQRGDYTALIVTESSRLDRREDIDALTRILLDIRAAHGDIISISEPHFGKNDLIGSLVTTVAQYANAEKSRTVKNQTYRGISMVIKNKAHFGVLPVFWKTQGERWHKQAYCTDPAVVADIYERVANRESLSSIGRLYDIYQNSVRHIVRFAANHTGVIECSYSHDGQPETWAHEVTPVVDSALWWRANKVLDANMTSARVNRGGRPVARKGNWVSGVLDCPECGEKLFLNAGLTPVGNPRTPKLRCGGSRRERIACRRFKGAEARSIINLLDEMFASDPTDILAFQRVAGNAHELDTLNAELRKIQARLSATEDDDKLDNLIADRKAIKAQIESFVIVPDSYDYAPTGQTVAQMWNDGNDAIRRGMVRAVKESWGMALVNHEGQWRIAVNTAGSKDQEASNGIVDLGNGLCFRR